MIFFSSDLHFNHVACLELMPGRKKKLNVDTIPDMNDALIERFNSVLEDEDHLIILGDFLLGYDKEIHLPSIMSKLKGIKHLVYGNHDPMFGRKPEHQRYQLYLDSGFASIHSGPILLSDIIVDSPEYLLCHFPYKTSVTVDHDYERLRYGKLYPDYTGYKLLHGHTHSSNQKTCGNSIHVGVDAWSYYPVSLEEVDQLFRRT